MEEKLVDEYIGEGAETFKTSKFNWVAAVLGQAIGPIWFFYRKAHLVGVLFILLTFVVGLLAGMLGIKQGYYIMALIYGFTANKCYLWDVRRKVQNIINTYPDYSEEQLAAIAREKGGKSVIAVIMYGLVFVGLIMCMIINFIIIANSFSSSVRPIY